MLKLAIIEDTAALRTELLNKIGRYLQSKIAGVEQIPKISLLPLAPTEARFNAEPDIVIIGESFASLKTSEIRDLKVQWPNAAIIVHINDLASKISSLSALAAMGVDDTLSSDASAAEFLSKLLIISRRVKRNKKGRMVLIDSGKGGLGVTTLTAALGEALFETGQKTLLVDFDSETQDLCRFLQARPFFNHNLQSLINEERPITAETVSDCLVPVWPGEENLYCMPPCQKEDAVGNVNQTRALLSVLEVCDHLFDTVLVDIACLKGAALNTLYRVCDSVLYVISNDPAALYPAVARYKKISTLLPLNVSPRIIINAAKKNGLNTKILKTEFNIAANTEDSCWVNPVLYYSEKASRWPGSKLSLFSLSNASQRRAIKTTLANLSLISEPDEYPRWLNFINKIASTALALPAPLKALPAPSLLRSLKLNSVSGVSATATELPTIKLSYVGQSENFNEPIKENTLPFVS